MQAPSHGAATATRPTTSTEPVTSYRVAQGNAAAPRLIAIVGAGFSGTAVAIHLLRNPPRVPTRVVLIDPRDAVGAGVAYATRDYPYPLNVAAGQMSLDAAQPADFLEFVRSRGIHAEAGDYLPRQVYGEYLRSRFEAARAAAPAHLACQHHRAHALQLRRAADGRWDLWLDDGTALRPAEVVLALGNPQPACLPELHAIAATPRYVSDPWSIGSLAGQELDSVLLVGSGLTMVDAALRLAAVRPRVRHIRVLSRHGWLPQPQASDPRPARKPDVRGALDGARGSVRALLRAFRALTREADAAGGDWREVLALARNHLPTQWRALDLRERKRFLRHARSVWDVQRHRVPAGPLAAVHGLARTGVLELHAGRLEEVNPADDAVEVIWRPRGGTRTRAWLVDRVINCTGPDSRAANHGLLVQSLLANGLIRTDELALGIDVHEDGRVLSREGSPVDGLHYIGPWLRARDWEATAVPELREHARQLAQKLAEAAAAVVTC